jgi:hypothetical protein
MIPRKAESPYIVVCAAGHLRQSERVTAEGVTRRMLEVVAEGAKVLLSPAYGSLTRRSAGSRASSGGEG